MEHITTADYFRDEQHFWEREAATAVDDSYRIEASTLARQARERANHHERAAMAAESKLARTAA